MSIERQPQRDPASIMLSLRAVFQRKSSAEPSAQARYDMLADAVYWTDELPRPGECDPNIEWSYIRLVLRHRTLTVLDQASEYGDWWVAARAAFPAWVGFLDQRCDTSGQNRTLVESLMRHCRRR